MAKKDDAPKKKKAEKKPKEEVSEKDSALSEEEEIARVEAEMAAAVEKDEAAAAAESANDDVDDDEIAKVEAEMAAAAAAEEEAAAAGESTDTDSALSEEEEIAKVEAEMAAAVEKEEADSLPDAVPEPQAAKSANAAVEKEAFQPPTVPQEAPKQQSLDLESDSDLGAMREVEVEVKGVIFQKYATIGELAKIEVGTIMRGSSAEEPLIVQVGERHVAKGRAVVVDDRYGVVIDELII